MPTLTIVSTTQTSCEWKITGLDYKWDSIQYNHAYIVVTGKGTSTPTYPPTPPGSGYETGTRSFGGLSPGTSYTATGYVITPGNVEYNIGTATFTTRPPAPGAVTNLAAAAYNQTSGYATWTNAAYTSYCKVTCNGVTYTVYGTSQNFFGLAADTVYTVSVTPYNVDDNAGPSRNTNFKTPGARPANFSWTNAKNSNQPFNLTAAEWNELATRIDQFRAYKGLTPYGFTTAYPGNNFEAYMFNQAVNAISGMNPPTSPPGTVSSGGTIYAAQLDGLVDSLNSII